MGLGFAAGGFGDGVGAVGDVAVLVLGGFKNPMIRSSMSSSACSVAYENGATTLSSDVRRKLTALLLQAPRVFADESLRLKTEVAIYRAAPTSLGSLRR